MIGDGKLGVCLYIFMSEESSKLYQNVLEKHNADSILGNLSHDKITSAVV